MKIMIKYGQDLPCSNMSRVMKKKKKTFCNGENKGAHQRLCFLYKEIHNSSSFYIQNCQPLAIFCACTARFVSDLVGNRIVECHDAVHLFD